MRNATVTLSPAQQAKAQRVIQDATVGATVRIAYAKRDGSAGHATGTILAVVGDASLSTSALKIDTERGPRTVNTYAVSGMRVFA